MAWHGSQRLNSSNKVQDIFKLKLRGLVSWASFPATFPGILALGARNALGANRSFTGAAKHACRRRLAISGGSAARGRAPQGRPRSADDLARSPLSFLPRESLISSPLLVVVRVFFSFLPPGRVIVFVTVFADRPDATSTPASASRHFFIIPCSRMFLCRVL